MGKLPDTKEGLEAAGYVFDGEGRCKACGVYLQWWITPTSHKMPIEVVQHKDGDGLFARVTHESLEPHWAKCEKAKEFRNGTYRRQ